MNGEIPLPPVSKALQVNLHPFDAPHAALTLPHQLRVWGGQVDRILLTVDTGQVGAGRYKGNGFEPARKRLFDMLDEMQANYPHLHIDEVDYSESARKAVTDTFFSRSTIPYPAKAFDGGPFHVYFHGLRRANARYVLHMDSDMMFGGGSQSWFDEAIELQKDNPDALCITPFSGPPTVRGDLDITRHVGMPGVKNIPIPRKLPVRTPTWRFATVSTRLFMIDMERFAKKVTSLELLRPDVKRRIRSVAYNQQPISMPAEEVLSENMMRLGVYRLDFLGEGKGMYSLHPPYRSPEFYAALPSIVERIEKGDIPEEQLGDFDINGSMVDWTSALAAKTKSKRYAKALRHLITANIQRFGKA
ncbi:polysaccharide biosynthesis glycosyltransferase UppG [Rhizobium sp. RM]|uniref:polysaccharide biosynthesis glycosyltransferase UppG n=1 Tax=Rhizobium sp. RM TaxID=2748079 RepID=UPI00110F5A7A|nr:polysaccharide biosynthesis glycosyltransferase UppG [Rhizobium sp. RM]NWJ26919.1 glycosyltransferase family 2 protein [Rhizobium sp. RM]TMV22784.1 glycosyltransferase family 2 protein [Rhizobium sp. Td3]